MGEIEHTLLVGGDYCYFQNTFDYPSFDPMPPIDIFNPVYSGNLGLLPTNDLDNGDLGYEWFGLYLQDQIELPYNVHLLAGMRYDNGNSWQDFGAGRGTSTDGGALKPQTSQSWEVGIKNELFDGRLNMTAAYFNLTKQNIATPIPNSRFSALWAKCVIAEWNWM